MTTRLVSLVLFALFSLSTTLAFAPSSLVGKQRIISSLSAAASVDAVSYDAFVPGKSKELAIKDDVVGSGDEAKEGQMLTVSFTGRTMTSNVEQNVKEFSFKLGDSEKVMKGWQQGLPGMKVGGKRLLRIPAGELTKSGNDEDLEFQVELLSSTEGAFNEFLINNGIKASTKTYGILALMTFSAVIPLIQKAGIIT